MAAPRAHRGDVETLQRSTSPVRATPPIRRPWSSTRGSATASTAAASPTSTPPIPTPAESLRAPAVLCEAVPVLRLQRRHLASVEMSASKYLDYLKREIDLVASRLPNRRKVVQLHWGGGTPTYFSPGPARGAASTASARHFDIQAAPRSRSRSIPA